jgi:hypothetical protein
LVGSVLDGQALQATSSHPGKSRRDVDGVIVRRLPSAVADAAGIMRAFG